MRTDVDWTVGLVWDEHEHHHGHEHHRGHLALFVAAPMSDTHGLMPIVGHDAIALHILNTSLEVGRVQYQDNDLACRFNIVALRDRGWHC